MSGGRESSAKAPGNVFQSVDYLDMFFESPLEEFRQLKLSTIDGEEALEEETNPTLLNPTILAVDERRNKRKQNAWKV